MSTFFPLVVELRPPPDPATALAACEHLPHVLLLESSLRRGELGRYSFLTADPFQVFTQRRVTWSNDPLAAAREAMSRFNTDCLPELPPFQGGAAGLLAYETGGAWERIPRAGRDEFQFPDVSIGLYDWVLAWDHAANRAWLISQGFPETDPAPRAGRAAARLAAVQALLHVPETELSSVAARESTRNVDSPPIAIEERFPLDHSPGEIVGGGPARVPDLSSNFSHAGYLRAVERAIEYIAAGDIFQVNLSQRLLVPQCVPALELYRRLRSRNPSPFGGYLRGENWTVVSASPERFVCVRGDDVETRPIKGTRRRSLSPEADLFTRDALRESDKDQAENVMIVDLLRNDLSRICRPGTVRVPQLCGVETYETVQHLVSEVRGRLQPAATGWSVWPAMFPGGSITGAPKVRAMEIIAELEPTARGAYCGSLFYLGFDGQMDSSILIRTFTVSGGWVQCCVGGGIVAQSDPEAEYRETLHKAEGMLRAFLP